MTTENQVKPTDVDKALLGTATYRSLGEQRLSPNEERFEKGRRTVGLFLAPLITVVFLVRPIDIPREQQVLAAVLLGVIVLWISEAVPIPIGGLLGVAVAVFLGVAPVDDVLGPFGSSTISRSSVRSSWPRRCSNTASPGGSRSGFWRCRVQADPPPG